MAGAIAVDKQVHGAGNGGLACKTGQRVFHQIRAQREVARHLQAAHAHGAAPTGSARHHVAQSPGQHALFVGVGPAGVIAGVARILVCAATQDAGVGEHAALAEEAQFVPGRHGRAPVLGGAGEHVVVEHQPGAGEGGLARSPQPAQFLRRQPRGRQVDQQPLVRNVVLHLCTAQKVDDDLVGADGGRYVLQRHAQGTQTVGIHQIAPAALHHGHHLPGGLAIDDQLKVQQRVEIDRSQRGDGRRQAGAGGRCSGLAIQQRGDGAGHQGHHGGQGRRGCACLGETNVLHENLKGRYFGARW
ncbi:hypothetical protein SDC9_88444 [bioreactor metagenome]|uniref:Uncharacterized protein n=1 Tax=bioreactor metagenome TaxID=1076179 RepID=A0A644ZLM3_9ZZZZ